MAIKRTKNLKITPTTHKLLKEYCDENGLKMFAFIEKLIKENCKNPTDLIKYKAIICKFPRCIK